MKATLVHELANGISVTSTYHGGKSSKRYYLPDARGKYTKSITKSKQSRTHHKSGFLQRVREHAVKLGPKITDTVKGKLSMGARILQVGGVEKVFMQLFSVAEGEKLLKASQCYLSTTSGPMAGLLFISSDKVAFCSDRSIRVTTPDGENIRVRYKVSIPLKKIKSVNKSQNAEKPSQKYIEIVTVDDFDFWFLGFFHYQKALKCLQQAVSQS
ncbi:GEM-like protein 4 [Vigna radiata var. radiata]|uniref:GEM-like protein 4 n=1 Tax=Vigna radiata var. radiata TaxID=3916 RepID=A0A1S3V383_VIGRR|nr:GEM-like protein 4 [Vigna radiata var. radiata]